MKKPTILLLTLCLALLCQSQSGLYISGTTPLSIRANNLISIDGLVLTPSSHYVITGSNSVTRASTLLHPSITPAIHRSFQWVATLPAFTGTIGFYYTDAELNGLAEGELTLNVHNGTQWQAYESGVSRNATLNLVTTPVSGLLINELALAAEAQPLPLEWGQIRATRQNGTAMVEWQTHNEVNTSFFVVERREDGLQWRTIGQPVAARNLLGMHTYHCVDSSVSNQKTFYRIKQVDRDEQWRYSKTAWVPAWQPSAALSLYPNPANQQIIIRSAALPIQTLWLFDATGQLHQTILVPNATTHILPIASLPKGVYWLQVQLADGSTTHLSFIKN